MPLDVRVSVYDSTKQTLLANDISGDLTGGLVSYEDTPAGCGAGKLSLGLRYPDVYARGNYKALNVFEISTGDNTLAKPIAAGATKAYLTEGTWSLDPAQGEDAQQLYFFDGAKLTMRLPVTGIGSDSGGAFVTFGAPDGRNGNPSSMPAYGAGTIKAR